MAAALTDGCDPAARSGAVLKTVDTSAKQSAVPIIQLASATTLAADWAGASTHACFAETRFHINSSSPSAWVRSHITSYTLEIPIRP